MENSKTFRICLPGAMHFLVLTAILYGFPAPAAERFWYEPLNADPGWTIVAPWEFGRPLGQGSAGTDPTAGHTGLNVYGGNLAGDVSNSGYAELTTTEIDCTGHMNVELVFRRWLNTDGNPWNWDNIEVANNEWNWTRVWSAEEPIRDSAWQEVRYDISAMADGKPRVRIRWNSGPHFAAVAGWNIDDVSLEGDDYLGFRVAPEEPLTIRGFEGGSFLPLTNSFEVLNVGWYEMDWTASSTSLWFSLSPQSGTIRYPGTNTVLVSLTTQALALSTGVYESVVEFTSDSSDPDVSRRVVLEVLPLPGEIEVSDSIAPADDGAMPFGELPRGGLRREQVVIRNEDAENGLVVSNVFFGTVLEHFDSDPPPDWREEIDAQWQVVDGMYRAQAVAGHYDDARIAYVGRNWQDCWIEATVWQTGSHNSDAVLVARASDDFKIATATTGDGYLFMVSPNGRYDVSRQVDGMRMSISPSETTPHWNPGNYATNTLALCVNGSDISAYVNGHLLWSGTDTVIQGPGRVYLSSLIWMESTVFYWDDVIIRPPSAPHPILAPGANSPTTPGSVLFAPEQGTGAGGSFSLHGLPPLPYRLPPGGSLVLEVDYSPVAFASNNMPLVVRSNDPDEPWVELLMTGVGTGDYLEVLPESPFLPSGHPGGPFAPSNAVYQLTNSGPASIDWQVSSPAGWLEVVPATGTLPVGGRASVTARLTAEAYASAPGVYNSSLVFSNVTVAATETRMARLVAIGEPDLTITPHGIVITNVVGCTITTTVELANSALADADLAFTLRTRVGAGGGRAGIAANHARQAVEQKISHDRLVFEYAFPPPLFGKRGDYDIVTMEGCDHTLQPRAPAVPLRPVSILVPNGKEITGIRVDSPALARVAGTYAMAPAEEPHPLGIAPAAEATTPDPAIYDSDDPWPGTAFKRVGTYSKRGHRLLVLNLFPLQYRPLSGKVEYARSLRLTVDLHDASDRGVVHGSAELTASIADTVDNPGTLATYAMTAPPAEEQRSASTLPDRGPYDYLIVTSQALTDAPPPWNFQRLCDLRRAQGLAPLIVTTEWIYANYGGTRPDGGEDDQTRIRNFLTAAYQAWGARYVLLGGGHPVVPARIFTPGSNDEAADLYYGCVDPTNCTFDGDADGVYGEPNDGPGGADVDIVAEMYVGRALVKNADEVAAFVRKTVTYDATCDPYLSRITMLGCYLGHGGEAEYAKPRMEQVRCGGTYDGYFTAGFTNHAQEGLLAFDTSTNLYDADGIWTTSDGLALMNGGTHAITHLGHSGVTRDMKLHTSELTALTNENHFFVHSSGCGPGWFTVPDCFAEEITAMEHGAFAAIMNFHFGWGLKNSTDGASPRHLRQFWDAVLGEGILELGRANQDSKEDNLVMIDIMRFREVAYGLNLFGDPAQKFRFERSPDWLRVSPTAETASPGSATVVRAVFDASTLGPGSYNGEIVITSNDPNPAQTNVPCTMVVVPPTTNVTLTVASLYGSPTPPRGSNTVEKGSSVSCTVAGSPVENGTTQYVCTGWAGTGTVPATGTGTNAGAFALTDDSTIAWQWQTNYAVQAIAGDNGTVTPSGCVYVARDGGTGFVVRADTYYHIAALRTNGVEVPAIPATNLWTYSWSNVTAAGTFGAVFAADLAAHGTPCWWLAAFGLTNADWNTEAMADRDGDGAPAWMERRADTDPTDSNSVLRLLGVGREDGSATVRWRGGRRATQILERSSSLAPVAGWVPIHTNPPDTPTINTHIDTDVGKGARFYRIRVHP